MMDLAALRKEFPVLEEKVNGKPLIYLDNAATTKPYEQVVEKMRLIDEQVWGNPSSIHYQ